MAKQAVEAPRRTMFLVDPNEVVLIGRDTKDGPNHPRYDVRVLNDFDEAIVEGMIKFGVKKPISVIKVGDRLEVVDGRQRVINAREANRRIIEAGGMPLRIPLLPPEQGTDSKMFGLTILLNEHVVADTPFGRGQKAQKAFEMGYSEEEIANLFRVSIGTVKNYMSLLALPNEIQQMVVGNKVAATKGYELAQKGEKAQKAFLVRLEKGSRSGPPKRTPSKQALRKLVEEGTLPEMFLQALKYALGDITLDEVRKLPTAKAPEALPEPEPTPEPEAKGRAILRVVPDEKPKKAANPFLV